MDAAGQGPWSRPVCTPRNSARSVGSINLTISRARMDYEPTLDEVKAFIADFREDFGVTVPLEELFT